MNLSTLNHRIKCPEGWAQKDRLDAHLWKAFPMDAFVYIEDRDSPGPEYLGTTVPADPWLTFSDREKSSETYVDEVAAAVQAFAAEAVAA